MKRILLNISYDGTNYNGYATGGTGVGIETILKNTLCDLLNEDVFVIGASRTDAGVHAKQNVVVFDTDKDINVSKFYYAINNVLPNDIVITKSFEVPLSFHPRKVETIKTYEYKIFNSKIRNPFMERYTHFVYYDIDINKMIDASKFLIGQHDFRSFVNPDSNLLKNAKKNDIDLDKIAIRTIYDIAISKNDENVITIMIKGNGFLYNMVRIICGTLLKVGMNMWEPLYVKQILEKKDRKYAGFTLPAKGLTLVSISFINEDAIWNCME